MTIATARPVAVAVLLAFLGGCAGSPEPGPVSRGTEPVLPVVGPHGDAPPTSGRDAATLPAPLAREVGVAAVSGTTEPVIIDTRTFVTQIDRRRFEGEGRRPATLLPKHRKPPLPAVQGDNGLRFGRGREVARAMPAPAFPGISQTPWSPPDPSIAVGPNHVLATVNMKIAWYDKNGTPQFEQFLDSTGDPGFFEEIGGGSFTFDPKCFYDPHVGRFVVLALEYYSGSGEAWMTFAVSDDDDPNGIWFKYRTWALVSSQGSDYWVDYPGFGFDERGWYVTSNLFELGSGPGPGFLGGLLRVIDKSGPMSGGTAVWSDVLAGGASWQVTQVPDAGEEARIVRQWSADTLELGRIVGPVASPSIESSLVAVPRVDGDGEASTPVGAGLWIVDPRIMNATMRDGTLWCTNHGRPSGASNACGVWYAVDCTGAAPVFQQGGAFQFGGAEESFFPAVAVNGAGQAAVVYGRSSPDRHPTLEIAGRLPSDPANTMSAGLEIGASVTSPSGTDSLNRWGDYFDATVDPSDDRTFWVVGELQTGDGWITEIASFSLGLPADLNGDGAVDGADFGILLAAWGDAGGPADLNHDGTVNGADIGLLLGEWSE